MRVIQALISLIMSRTHEPCGTHVTFKACLWYSCQGLWHAQVSDYSLALNTSTHIPQCIVLSEGLVEGYRFYAIRCSLVNVHVKPLGDLLRDYVHDPLRTMLSFAAGTFQLV